MLVVDDDELIVKSWQRALQAQGKTVMIARDRDSALAFVDPIPDVAIVDLNLEFPGAGLEVIRELKRRAPVVFTVLISAAMSVAQAVAAIKEGADDCAIKPVSPRQLIHRLEHDEPIALDMRQVLTLDEVAWEHIARVLADCGGNVSHAARALGLHRQSLQRKLRQLRPRSAKAAGREGIG